MTKFTYTWKFNYKLIFFMFHFSKCMTFGKLNFVCQTCALSQWNTTLNVRRTKFHPRISKHTISSVACYLILTQRTSRPLYIIIIYSYLELYSRWQKVTMAQSLRMDRLDVVKVFQCKESVHRLLNVVSYLARLSIFLKPFHRRRTPSF